jgi:DNA-binding beta-propeller fold protein YncE
MLKIQEVVKQPDWTIEDMYSRLAVIDAVTMDKIAMIPVCPAMHGIAVSADGSEAYITCYGSDELAIVDLTNLASPAIERFAVGPGVVDPTMPSYQPYAAAVSPADGSVWVSCLRSEDVRVFDPATRTWDEARAVTFGGLPFFADFTADGSRLYVPHQGDNAISIIDPAVGGASLQEVQLPLAACDKPHGVIVTPDEQNLLVVCEGDHLGPGTVAVLMREPAAVQTFFEVGVFPDDLIILGAP